MLRFGLGPPFVRQQRTIVLAAGLLVAIAGCGQIGQAPSPTPADFGGIANRLTRLGLSVTDIVSGDPGCADSTLAPAAISFTASGLDQPAAVHIHLYVFRDTAAFDRRRPDVDNCARSFITDPSAYASVAVSPYVIAAQGPWGSRFEEALRTGLTEAAQSGG